MEAGPLFKHHPSNLGRHLGPLQYQQPIEALYPPRDEADYGLLVKVLDGLLNVVGEDKRHRLARPVSRIADWIEAYDESLPRIP